MDRITKSLLDEFAEQNTLKGISEDKQFEHFTAYLAVGRHFTDTINTLDVVTGGGGDLGLDAIAIIINGTLVQDADQVADLLETNGYLDVTFVFVQADRGAKFDGSKIGNIGYGVREFFSQTPKMPRNEFINNASSIMNAVFAHGSKFKRGKPACVIYYMTTGKWLDDANLQARLDQEREDTINLNLFSEVKFLALGADDVQRMYFASKSSISREFAFPKRTTVPELGGVSQAYIGVVPAVEFLQLVRNEEGDVIKSLFYDNVRDWQNYNTVNSGIKTTLAKPESREKFALLNNGVTVIAKKVQATGDKFYIEDYQIVNGCQTSHVLHDNSDLLDDTVFVPLRLIGTEDEEVINSIIQATNSQTEVKREQLIALSDFQKSLENFFNTFGEDVRLYYERRSRQYSYSDSIEKTRVISLQNMVRAFASVFLNEPHRTTRNFRSLVDRVGDEIFGDDHKMYPYYAAATALYKLEYLFRNGSIDSSKKVARYHLLMAARYIFDANPLPYMNSKKMDEWAEKFSSKLWDSNGSIELFKAAEAAVDEVAKGNFDRDHVRTQSFTEKLLALFRT